MERLFETLGDGLGNGIGLAAETGVLFVIFAALWLAFGAALIISQGSVDASWQFIRSLPSLVQGLVWLLFLPLMVGLWIWETGWPLVLRLTLITGVAGWNLLIFLPRALAGRP